MLSQPADVLEDRQVGTVTRWLRDHSGALVVTSASPNGYQWAVRGRRGVVLAGLASERG